MSCPTTSRARTRATITASIRTSSSIRPSPAWAPTSTCIRDASGSAPADTLRELRRCAPQRSLPPCGGGTGRGVLHALPLLVFALQQTRPAVVLECVRETSLALGALSPPLSLSLPHK